MSPSWYSTFLLSSDKKARGTSGRFEQVTKSNSHMGEKHSKHGGVQNLTLIIFLFTFHCLQQSMVVFNVIPRPLTSNCKFQDQKVYQELTILRERNLRIPQHVKKQKDYSRSHVDKRLCRNKCGPECLRQTLFALCGSKICSQ